VNEEPPWQSTPDGQRYRCHIEPAELERLQTAGKTAEPEPDRAP
jgi:hypothetical protein